jgi:hypothetical protein
MKHLRRQMLILIGLTVLLSGCAESRTDSSPVSGRADGMSAAPAVPATTDYLQDCLARIPKDATSGQREIAERTCRRDLADRTTTVRGEGASSGTQGDTLQACMARIPEDASSGQRMIAEQSCERDEANRRSVQAVPGR